MKNSYKILARSLLLTPLWPPMLLRAGKVSGLSPVQSAALAAAILAEAELLQAEDQAAVNQKAASIAATERAQERHGRLAKMMSAAKYTMRGVDASPAEFDAVGITPPAETRSTVRPETPSGLSAYGENGGVRLRYIGNNVSGSVVYQIYGRSHPDGRWVLLGMTTKQWFVHKGVRPGEFHQYEIKARASDGTLSGVSNTAAVYTNG